MKILIGIVIGVAISRPTWKIVDHRLVPKIEAKVSEFTYQLASRVIADHDARYARRR